MDILETLIAERDRLDRAIAALEPEPPRDGRRRGRRRPGRPSGPQKTARKARRRTMSPAQREAVSKRMKKYWAARRKAAKKKGG